MAKAIAILAVIGAMAAMQIAVGIYGWGLTPQSWWWIIGVGVFGQAFVRAVGARVLKGD